jgi:pimeloyl-ACP methyl ester carboxylesterase
MMSIKGWVRVMAAVAAMVTSASAMARTQFQPLWATLPVVPPLPNPNERGFINNDGARLYYAVFHRGGGSPVILLHGGFGSSKSWGFEVPLLAGRHEVIVMDSRGHGRSSMPAGALRYEVMASDVIAVMDALHVRRSSIVGVSDGGIIGLILAIRHPDRIAKLYVWGANFNTHADSTSPPDPAMKGLGSAFLAKMEAQYRVLSPTPDGFPALRAALDDLYAKEPNLSRTELGSIRAPTVVADGEHEQFIARAHTEELARLIPGAKLVILPNVSHGGPEQDPVGFHRSVAALLDAAGGEP